jgi:hypothetical protein
VCRAELHPASQLTPGSSYHRGAQSRPLPNPRRPDNSVEDVTPSLGCIVSLNMNLNLGASAELSSLALNSLPYLVAESMEHYLRKIKQHSKMCVGALRELDRKEGTARSSGTW